MKKRFKDENGNLTVFLSRLAELTYEEACEYYILGEIYMFENQEYLLTEVNEEAYIFTSPLGNKVCINTDRIGTFLPDVASQGNEIIRVE